MATSGMIPPAQVAHFLAARKGLRHEWNNLWRIAWDWIEWPHDTEERLAWKEVIRWSEPYFRAAWENNGAFVAPALAVLLRALEYEEPGDVFALVA